jgi:tetratricopeptide (TPR) repeat protein
MSERLIDHRLKELAAASDPRARCRALLALAELRSRLGLLDLAQSHLDEAERTAAAQGWVDLQLRLDAMRTMVAYYSGDLEGALRESVRIRKASMERDGELVAHCDASVAVVLFRLGVLDEALIAAERALARADTTGDGINRFRALTVIGSVKGMRGDADGSIDAYRAAIAQARALGDEMLTAGAIERMSWTYVARLQRDADAGSVDAEDLKQALVAARNAEMFTQEAQLPALAQLAKISIGFLYVLADQPRLAVETLQSVLPDFARGFGRQAMEPAVGYAALAEAHAKLGDASAAAECVDRALASVPPTFDERNLLIFHGTVARVMDRIGRPHAATYHRTQQQRVQSDAVNNRAALLGRWKDLLVAAELIAV